MSALRMLAIDAMTAEVVTAMTSAGVSSILLKGPSVVHWLYADSSRRTYVDSDLLVCVDQWPTAEQTLADLGFVSRYAGTRREERDPHGTPWRRRRDGLCVDLHRTLPGVGVTPRAAWDLLAGHEASMTVAGVKTTVFNEPARALHVALHAAHNGPGNQQSLRDLELAIERVPIHRWREAASLASELDAVASLAAGLRLLPEGAVLANILRLSPPSTTTVQLRAISAPPLALAIEALKERPEPIEKLRYVLDNLVPSPAFMRLWLPMARRGRIGLAGAYIWRWVWLARHAWPGYLVWKRFRVRTEPERSVVAERPLAASAVHAPTKEK